MATPIPENRCGFSLGGVVQATSGTLHGNARITASSVSIDTRTLKPGSLFVALHGAGRDGHDFVPAAVKAGAVAAVLERGRGQSPLASVEVPDTLAALGMLARFHLERMRAAGSLISIGITGSAGKTTTKELTAAAAHALFGETLATPGNLNNRIGVPMTLFTLGPQHRAAVIECGTNLPGEVDSLGTILAPDAALVVNVDIEHSEGLGSLEQIAAEETAILRHAKVAVVPAGDALIARFVPSRIAKLTFGTAAEADVRLTRRIVVGQGRQRVTYRFGTGLVEPGVEPVLETELAVVGPGSAINAAAALAAVAACAHPLSRERLAALARAVAEVNPIPGRLAPLEVAGALVIDDTYNANPRSVQTAFEAAREIADGLHARLVVALGDMLELGSLAIESHRAALRALWELRPDAVILVGSQMGDAFDASPSPASVTVVRAPDSDAASRLATSLINGGDVVLVKGSRGMRMERLIEALAQR